MAKLEKEEKNWNCQVMVPATKPNDLSSIPRTQEERSNFYKLSNCYTTAVAHTSHSQNNK